MRLALVVVLVAAAARAQDSAVVRACDRASTGKIQAAFYGQLVTIPLADMAAIGPNYMNDVLEAVRRSLHPGPLGLGVYEIWRDHAALSGATTVIFSLTQKGTMSDLGLASSSLSPGLDRAVYSAVQRADSAQLFVPLPEQGPRRVTFYLTVFIDRYPDTTVHRGRSGLVAPLLTTTLPGWEGDVTLPGATTSHPVYPEYARMENVEDSLLVRFVIDEHGNVDPSSIWFETGTYREFAKSIRDWLPHAKYSPGRIGGCRVKVLTQQAFKYRLSHPK
jgi:TonB-like protein